MKQKIPVLDSGAQLYAAICRVCDELGVEPVFLTVDTHPETLKDYNAFIISGGAASCYEPNAPALHPETAAILKNNPGRWKVLGICYGMQLLTQLYGGKVSSSRIKEYGKKEIHKTGDSPLFAGLPDRQRVLMSHGDSIEELAAGFEEIAVSQSGLTAAIQDRKRGVYGVQFHPEALPISTHGKQIIANFLFFAAGYNPATPRTIEDLMQEQRDIIRREVKPGQKVYVGLSGGVDSTVAATIAEQELGAENCIGFTLDVALRKGEAEWIKKTLGRNLKMPIRVIRCEEEFLNTSMAYRGKQTKKLSEETDAAAKRAIFHSAYGSMWGRIVKEYGLDNALLLQGTIRPDLIESAAKDVSVSGTAQIKQHHNVGQGGLAPNRNLHKDQVRKIAEALGLPPEIAYRQPFPGPGLFPRIICAERPVIDEKYQKTAKELAEYAGDYRLDAVLLPIKTVGIKGDDRSYDFAAAISGKPEWKELSRIADEIPGIIHGVNRVFYIMGREIKGLNPEELIAPTHCTPDVFEQLREADFIVNANQEKAGIDSRKIAQFPVSLLPVNFGIPGNRTVALRPFITDDFYTGLPAIPAAEPNAEEIDEKVIDDIAKELQSVKGISAAAFDLTSKPPGTTELE